MGMEVSWFAAIWGSGGIGVAPVCGLRRYEGCVSMLFAAVYCLHRPEQDWVVGLAICGYGSSWVKRAKSNFERVCYILARRFCI